MFKEPPSQLVAEEISEPRSVWFKNTRSLAPMQSRKQQQGAGRSLWCTPKQAPELETQYLVERRGSLLWAGTRRNVPVKHVTAGCLGTRAGDRSLKCLVDFSGTSSFLKEGGQTEKKKKKGYETCKWTWQGTGWRRSQQLYSLFQRREGLLSWMGSWALRTLVWLVLELSVFKLVF